MNNPDKLLNQRCLWYWRTQKAVGQTLICSIMAQPRISFFLEGILGLIETVVGIKNLKRLAFFQNWKKIIQITSGKKGKNTAKTLKWMCLKPVEGWLMKIWLRNWSSKIFPSPFNTMFIRQLQIKGLFHLVYLKRLIKWKVYNSLIKLICNKIILPRYEKLIWFDLFYFILFYSKIHINNERRNRTTSSLKKLFTFILFFGCCG